MSTNDKQSKMAASLAKSVNKAMSKSSAEKKTDSVKKSSSDKEAPIVFSSRRVWPD